MCRLFVLSAALLVLAMGGLTGVAAQDATPKASALATMGYPELGVRVTDEAVEAPAQVPAGRVLMTVENAGTQDAFVDIGQLPIGTTVADLEQLIAAPPEVFPAWWYEGTWASGPIVLAGGRAQSVVELTPGEWVVLASGAARTAQPVSVTEPTSGTPVTASEPVADVEILLQDYAFIGLPEQTAPGPQVWKLTNTGAEPHLLGLFRLPGPATFEQVAAIFSTAPGASPPAGAIDPAQLVTVGGIEALSPGQTTWTALDLEPGTYAALCFVPEPGTGIPHMAMGMVGVVTVA